MNITELERYVRSLEKRIEVLEKKKTKNSTQKTALLVINDDSEYTKLSTEIMMCIKRNFPGIISRQLLNKRATDGAHTIRKLHETHQFSLEFIKTVLVWATKDSFWRSNFQAIAPIIKPDQYGVLKFDKMISSWQSNSGLDGVIYMANQYLTTLNYDADEIDRLVGAVIWLYTELESFIDDLPYKHKANWHKTHRFKLIMQWFIDVDYDVTLNDVVNDGVGLLAHYFEYLKINLSEGRLKGIYANTFSNDRTFYRFVDYFNTTHNISIF